MKNVVQDYIISLLDAYLNGTENPSIDMNELADNEKVVVEKLQHVIHTSIQISESAFKREAHLKILFFKLGSLCNAILRGELEKKADVTKLPYEMRLVGISFNKVLNLLRSKLDEAGKNQEKLANYSRDLEKMLKAQEKTNKDLEIMADRLKAQQKEIEEKNTQLEQTSRLKSEFLANMSHELRTPLNAIIGFSDVLKDGMVGELTNEQKEYITDIFNSGQHLLSLINDILDLSKIEAGKMELDLEPTNISLLLHNSLSIVKERAMTHNIQLGIQIDNSIHVSQVDARKLKQIIFNLLSNAVKFTFDGGYVNVLARRVSFKDIVKRKERYGFMDDIPSCSSNQEFLEISVMDSGIGISKDNMKRLFKAFEQLDSSLSRKHEGTGLGLVLVKRLTRLHGGSIAMESKEGEGSCFKVWIPYYTDTLKEDLPAVPTKDKPLLLIDAARPLALIIEDDSEAYKLIYMHLETEGFNVILAQSAEAGLMLAKEKHPHLIMLDILLPNMDGWEFLSLIKNDEILKSIPVVIISIVADKARGFTLGASGVLQKPFNRQELTEIVDRLDIAKPLDHTPSVLVVDDDSNAVDIASRMLQEKGYEVLKAFGGKEGIEKARAKLPDLIVLDLMMPKVSGFDVAWDLKINPDTQHIPIIILTAKTMTPRDLEELNSNIMSIMEKGQFNGEGFIKEVRRALRRRT